MLEVLGAFCAALMLVGLALGLISEVFRKPDERFEDEDRLNFRS